MFWPVAHPRARSQPSRVGSSIEPALSANLVPSIDDVFTKIPRFAFGVRQHGHHSANSDTVNAQEINLASGEYDASKREEFMRDTHDEEDDSCTSVFQNVRTFCLVKVNSNCSLLNKHAKAKHIEQIHELVDLKLLPLI